MQLRIFHINECRDKEKCERLPNIEEEMRVVILDVRPDIENICKSQRVPNIL